MLSRLRVNVTLLVLFHLSVIYRHDPSLFQKFPGITLQVKNMLTHMLQMCSKHQDPLICTLATQSGRMG